MGGVRRLERAQALDSGRPASRILASPRLPISSCMTPDQPYDLDSQFLPLENVGDDTFL